MSCQGSHRFYCDHFLQGTKHFNIIPTTFILPGDANRFLGELYALNSGCVSVMEVEFCSLSLYLSLSLSPLSLLATFRKQRGTWIVKPTTLSRGRGIFLINHVSRCLTHACNNKHSNMPHYFMHMQPNQLPQTGEMVVSRYIENPLCIDGMQVYICSFSFCSCMISF